jgi:septum site-determining protein MinD
VLNKLIAEMMNAGYIPKLRVIGNIMKAELLGIIQFDMNINISTNIGEPIVLKRDSYIASNFQEIARRLRDRENNK